MPQDMTRFADSVREFLDSVAPRRPTQGTEVTWGEGSDRIAYFSSEPEHVAAAKVAAARAWQRTRYEAGFGWITGPAEYGGAALDTVHQIVYDDIESEYKVPDTGVLSVIGLGMIGPTILRHGWPEVRDHYLPRMYRGEIIACQLFSEPGAGSDLAGVETRAVRDGTGDEAPWILNGQKVWTSIAQHAEIGMVLCRTNPDVPKHKGITAFLVDMRAPGVEVRPLRQMSGGAEFNEVFLTDVRIPDEHRLGEVDGGWTVALTTLMNERATVGGRSGNSVAAAMSVEFLTTLARVHGRDTDAATRRDLAELFANQAATRYLNRQATQRLRAGGQPGPEGSISKLMYSANFSRATTIASEILGPKLVADTGEWGTFSWGEALLSAPALRILGGTEEIMKNILAERVLGLPKEPSSDSRTPFRELRRSSISGEAS